jgi:hypothetical protein
MKPFVQLPIETQRQVLNEWLVQLSQGKNNGISEESLKSTLSDANSSFEIKLLCSQVLSKLLYGGDKNTPIVIEQIMSSYETLTDKDAERIANQIKSFATQFTADQKKQSIDRLIAQHRVLLSKQDLVDRQSTSPKATISALCALGPSLTKEERKKLLDQFLKELARDKDRVIRLAAADMLGALAPALDKAEQKKVIDALLKVNDSERMVNRSVIEALSKFYPLLSEEKDKRSVASDLMIKVDASDWLIRVHAIRGLTSIYSSLPDVNDRAQFYKKVMDGTKSKNINVYKASTQAAAQLYPLLSADEKVQVSTALEDEYNDEQDVKEAKASARQTMNASIPQQKQMSRDFDKLCGQLTDTQAEKRQAAAEALAVLAPDLSVEQLDQLANNPEARGANRIEALSIQLIAQTHVKGRTPKETQHASVTPTTHTLIFSAAAGAVQPELRAQGPKEKFETAALTFANLKYDILSSGKELPNDLKHLIAEGEKKIIEIDSKIKEQPSDANQDLEKLSKITEEIIQKLSGPKKNLFGKFVEKIKPKPSNK